MAQRFTFSTVGLSDDFNYISEFCDDLASTVNGCWARLYRRKQCGWVVRLKTNSRVWGTLDKDAITRYGQRTSPECAAALLQGFGVVAAAFLGEVDYSRQPFLAAGLEHHEPGFCDTSELSRGLLARFLSLLDLSCKPGFCCSGDLIAPCTLLQHHFTAEEATAWLRIFSRSNGSIPREQQHYLHSFGPLVRRCHALTLSSTISFSCNSLQQIVGAGPTGSKLECTNRISESKMPQSAPDLPSLPSGLSTVSQGPTSVGGGKAGILADASRAGAGPGPEQKQASGPAVCSLDPSVGIKVFIVQNGTHLPKGLVRSFQNAPGVQYKPFCDDFGPFNMAATLRFVRQLQDEIAAALTGACRQLLYKVSDGARPLANAVTLLGSYLVVQEDLTADQAVGRFAGVDWARMEDFRDATRWPADFGLTVADCLAGLHRGKRCGWVGRPRAAGSPVWGRIDVERYAHNGSPLNGDLTEVVPGKFVAFKGPVLLPPDADRARSRRRRFAAAFHLEALRLALKDSGVTDVVRLNEPQYDARAFESAGIRHHDLFFEDCTAPPDAVAAAFFRIVDAARGAVAVHCKAGLGRTGTLIALCLMRSHGFTAREAMGWLRIMRPGSVMGEQQHYLCDQQRLHAMDLGASCLGPASPLSASFSGHLQPPLRSDGAGVVASD